MSFNPGMIGFAMNKKSYSGEMVRNNEKAVLAMPGVEIAKAAISCGTVSGRAKDKVKEFGIAMKNLPNCSIQIPTHTRLVIACKLSNSIEVGDHFLYICTVEEVYGDESQEALFAWDGYASLRPAR